MLHEATYSAFSNYRSRLVQGNEAYDPVVVLRKFVGEHFQAVKGLAPPNKHEKVDAQKIAFEEGLRRIKDDLRAAMLRHLEREEKRLLRLTTARKSLRN